MPSSSVADGTTSNGQTLSIDAIGTPTVASLAPDLGCVVLRLGGYRLDLVAALERVDDEVLEPVGDGGRVGIDDDQHALLRVSRAL